MSWKYYGPSELISALAANGRASLQELAVLTGTYPQAVSRSLERLSKENKIWGFRAVLDERSLGWQMYWVRMHVELVNADFEALVHGVQAMDANEHLRVLEAFVIDGDSDSNWVFMITAHNRIAVDAFVRQYEDLVAKAAKIRAPTVVHPVALSLRHGGLAPPGLGDLVEALQRSARTPTD